jgi:hypothetical protein
LRSLVGLDRQAVNDAFAEFLESGTASREQIEFVGLAVDRLTAQLASAEGACGLPSASSADGQKSTSGLRNADPRPLY